jgi:SAM-dependent methyltransferase
LPVAGIGLSCEALRRLLARRRPPIGAEQGPEWYDRAFSKTEEYHAPYQESPYYFLWTVIVDRLRRDGVRSILEVGCGSGQLAAFLIDNGLDRYVGFDFSPKAIELAERTAPAGRFLVDDARTSSLYEDQYEALICTEVLEHIVEDLAVVERFPQGRRCIFSVPSYNSASHVRFFANETAVSERYGPSFSALDVVAFPTVGAGQNALFLADGYR